MVGILVGYQPRNNTYRVWVPASFLEVTKGKLYESRDVTFDEQWRFYSSSSTSGTLVQEENVDSEEEENPDVALVEEADLANVHHDVEVAPVVENRPPDPNDGAELRRSLRPNKGIPPPNWWEVHNSAGDLDDVHALLASSDPQSVDEAFSGPDSEEWQLAYEREVSSLEARGVFEEVPTSELPVGAVLLPNKVVFRTKFDQHGDVSKYKARVVVKGCAQKSGRDYEELFAPVAKFTSLRCMISLAAGNDWDLRQFDIETAFLYAPLEEELYMKQPAGFEKCGPDGKPLIWRLKKSLYGLKQAPRNWYKEFSSFLQSYGFQKSAYDPCVFFFKDAAGALLCVLIVYVDDVPSGIAADPSWYKQFLVALKNKYNITEGPLEWCLGIQVVNSHDSIRLLQIKYINDILKRFNMVDCKPARVPLDPGVIFSFADSPKTTEEKAVMLKEPFCRFRALVGSLLYCAVATRPDISTAVSKIGHVMSNPGPSHWRQALHILRYLKHTKDLGLVFTKHHSSPNTLSGFCDADFANCVDSRKSTSGYFFSLNGGPICWQSKLQPVVSLSTTEAEYVALSGAGCEAVFVRGLLQDLGFTQVSPTIIFEDNTGCLVLSKDEAVLHNRTKHIDIKYHKIRELVAGGVINVVQCSTTDMIADVLTKLLPRDTFEHFRQVLMGYAKLK
jgi:hypothetical protein